MVTCSKCGTKNADEARFCVNCGANINLSEVARKRDSSCFGQPERRMDQESFGLPHGGTIVGLFIGIIIILAGLGNLFGWRIDFGAFVMILIGLLIIAGAIYGLSRRKSS